MIKFIAGRKGVGKTKQLHNLANDYIKQPKGDAVFIEYDKRSMYELDSAIRLVDIKEFEIRNLEALYGLICGVISNNFDIDKVYIDSAFKKINYAEDELALFIENIEKISTKFNIDFTFTLSIDDRTGLIPECVKQYL